MTFHQVKKPYLNTFDSISNLLSDGINANAHAILKDKLNKEKFLSYKKSTVIRNYIPIENFRRITDEAKEYERKKFNVNNEDILLLCVSNLIPYKGHMDLLEALKLLPEKFKLTIAGRDDGLWSDLEEFIVSNDLQNRVNYLGYCNKEKLNILYQVSDIYVSPSHTEGISNSIIEALIHELRVVATDAGGNAELLEDGKLGFICEASNPEDLAKKITAASKKLENISYGKDYIYRKYSKENMLNCYLKSWKI